MVELRDSKIKCKFVHCFLMFVICILISNFEPIFQPIILISRKKKGDKVLPKVRPS